MYAEENKVCKIKIVDKKPQKNTPTKSQSTTTQQVKKIKRKTHPSHT